MNIYPTLEPTPIEFAVVYYSIPGRVINLKPSVISTGLYDRLIRDYRLYLAEYRRQLNHRARIAGIFLTSINSKVEFTYHDGNWWMLTTHYSKIIKGAIPDVDQVVKFEDGAVQTRTHRYHLNIADQIFDVQPLSRPVATRAYNHNTSLIRVEGMKSVEESRQEALALMHRMIGGMGQGRTIMKSMDYVPTYRSNGGTYYHGVLPLRGKNMNCRN